MYQLRVWCEDIEGDRLRITWGWVVAPDPRDPEAEAELVRRALQELPNIKRAKLDNPGLVLTLSSGGFDRAALAATVRSTLGAIAPLPPPPPLEPEAIRVWAEELGEDAVRLSWEVPPESGTRNLPADRRAVAAWLTVQPGVAGAALDADGVRVRLDESRLSRRELAGMVRHALCVPGDLRSRTNDLLKRGPVYANIARSAAFDKRISPLPDVARQTAQRRTTPASTALRFVPGYATISRIQMLLPIIQGLSAWSREAPPEVVEEHLTRAGLTREQLTLDYATAEEGKLYLRETAGQQTTKATAAARSALDAGRDWFDRRNRSVESS